MIMKRKVIAGMLTAVMAASLLAGCGGESSEAPADTADTTNAAEEATAPEEEATADSEEASSDDEEKAASDVTLEWEITATGEKVDMYQEVADAFTEETGIKVELVTPGSDYETVMKTRMASGDLPDLWETHGWSVARYSEYLRPLNDQDWFDRMDESILPVISDADGNVYCIPIGEGLNTISYNKDVFEDAGVNPADILTWSDYEEACEKIKASGVTPIFCGDKDSSTIAQLAESIPPAFLTLSCVEDNQAENLKAGSFDFETYWTPINEMIDGWMQKGYFNEDILTSDNDQAVQALAKGEAGMVYGGSNNILMALTYNPDANLGYLACPGLKDGDNTFLSIGEGACIGMWKDTEHEEECLQLLSFLASPEICEKICTFSGDIPGFKDVTNEDSVVTKAFRESQSTWGNIEYVPLFDREFMPSGMWDDLGVGLTKLILDPGNAIKDSADYLQEAYNTKMAQ